MTVAAVLPAAGRGERLGGGVPKALRLLDGEPLLVHAVRRLQPVVEHVLIAAPETEAAGVRALLPRATVVVGGATRQQSVRNALAALPPGCDIVLVHDAARALAPTSLADAVARRVAAGAAAVIPALPVSDTIKRVDGEGRVVDTLDRAALRAVQTPQGFRRDLLVAVHERAAAAGFEATDDASLAEWAGEAVVTVPGSPLALKVTHPLDLRIAEVLLRAE